MWIITHMSDFNQKTADRSVYLYSVGFDFFHLELIFLNRRKKNLKTHMKPNIGWIMKKRIFIIENNYYFHSNETYKNWELFFLRMAPRIPRTTKTVSKRRGMNRQNALRRRASSKLLGLQKTNPLGWIHRITTK